MSQTCVSVVIPCHNRSKILLDCLKSVNRQTYKNIEVIIVDDASTENIQEVVESLQWSLSHPPQYIRLSNNQGPGVAREMGRQNATGDYISYLDSDDCWHIKFVESILETFIDNPDVGMSYCSAREFQSLPITGKEIIRKARPVSRILPFPLYRRPWDTGAIMWTRAASDKIGAWFPAWTGEDTEYEIRAGCLDVSVAYTPRPLFYYRIVNDEEKLSIKRKRDLGADIPVTEKIVQNIVKHKKIKELCVAEFCAWFLLKKVPGRIKIGRIDLARLYLSKSVSFCKHNSIITFFLLAALGFSFLPSFFSERTTRLMKRVYVWYLKNRWSKLFTGWT